MIDGQVAVFDEHGIFEIRDPMLLEVVSAGGALELSGSYEESTNSGCVNAVCVNGGNQACANTNVRCENVRMRFCAQVSGNGVNNVCV